MTELARQNPRYGYRRIWALLRREGWKVNKKRIYRLWRRERLKVPQKQHKKSRLGTSENTCVRRRPERKDHVWAWDFIHDRTAGGSAGRRLFLSEVPSWGDTTSYPGEADRGEPSGADGS